ncbi:MAG TPA: nucleotidyltransferase domain-containing protein [Xanthobacteraceae bacterium]|nr:nucleotidyltransferase domain-containing protein [Xanthobacteraceae bacterium]
MTTVQTLADRKKARVEEIRTGFAQLREELTNFALSHHGKFWIYGSAATGRFHVGSDIDIVVDFDDRHIGQALDFVEQACNRLGLTPDVQPKAWCTDAFLEKIAAKALLLP